MDSIILLRCSTVPGFNVVWIPSQRLAWGITHSASAIRKSKAYGKPDYQASATVISESHRVMAIADEAQTDGGRLEDPEHR